MKITYRPEIDGLRGIAVIAVVLYHSQIIIFEQKVFKGGFIGVDIFFVISGYLITSLILKELFFSDTFSFKHFFERRIRRILPVLLIVMLVSMPFAWIYMLPSSFVDFSKSILSSLGFNSNLYFWYSGQKYGAENSLLIPFLHTWSLSIEEQFYILFPFILLIIFRNFKKILIYFLAFGFIVSIIFADWASQNYSSLNFYVLPTRAWELLAGSILAYFEITKGRKNKIKILNTYFPIIGFFLIGYSIFFFNDKMFHPSFYTLSPIIGVSLIIWYSNKDDLTSRILSTKLLVGLGLISYSLYLWHYPIFSFLRITLTSLTEIEKIGCIFLSIVLSIVSYFLIEKPARNKNKSFSIIASIILIIISILIIFNLSVVYNLGYKKRLPQILQNSYTYNILDFTKFDDVICDKDNIICKSNVSSGKKIFLIGDSQMETLIIDLNRRVTEKNYQFIKSTIGGCLYFPGFDKIKKKTKKKTICNDQYFTQLKNILSEEKNSIIIFGGRYFKYLNSSYFDDPEEFVAISNNEKIGDSFKRELTNLSKKNKIILIYPIPEAGFDPNKILYLKWINQKGEFKNYLNSEKLSNSFAIYKNKNKSSFKLLDNIEGENIYKIYPHTLFCNNYILDKCITHDKKHIFYEDGNHPSLKGAEMINNLIIKEIEKIEKE